MTPGQISRMERMFGEMVAEEAEMDGMAEKKEAHVAACAGGINSADRYSSALGTFQVEETLTKKESRQQSQSEAPDGKAFLHLHATPDDVLDESQKRVHTLMESNRKK